MAGQLSKAGVPVFVADIKGDLTGLAAPGDATNARLLERTTSLGWTFQAAGHPVEFLSLSGKLGAQVRATVHSFGPLLLGKVLDLNDTQTSILSLVFKYCDDNDLPLLDLKDLAATLKYLSSDDGKSILADYGGMSSASVGVLLRTIVVIEQEGADVFFGEPEFEVEDLLRTTPTGEGIISVLELSDVMDKPRLFSTFMLWMLAQLYESLPEAGDLPKPKLCFFFDEAHLLFDDATDALMEQVERTARLIRSKGVGVYFVTQAPTDVPGPVLAQLGNRVQHALRAFTPDDADALRKTARTFPTTTFFDVEKTITSLGIGEALITVLSPRGVPTPLAATRLLPPDSLMAPIDEVQFRGLIATSPYQAKYGTTVDRDSAYERITARIAAARAAAGEAAIRAGVAPTTSTGLNTMTPAQQQREVNRQAKEIAAAQRAAERQRKAEATAKRADARAQQRTIDNAIRTGGRVVTSRIGQDLVRGIFGTLFGGGKGR
jgi:DNA helicase HerA-like ATPase